MPTLSGNPKDWSKGFDVPRTSELLIGPTTIGTLLYATHKCVATTKAPEDPTKQLCGVSFSPLVPLPVPPTGFSNSPNTIPSYNEGTLDSYPLAYLFSGGIIRGRKSITLNLTYAAKLITTLTPSFLPDPETGTYPTGAGYRVVADGVTIVDTTVVPSAAALSIPVNKTVNSLSITFKQDDGAAIWRGWIPNTNPMQSAVLSVSPRGLILDPWGGNILPVPLLECKDSLYLTSIMIEPQFV